MKKILLLITLLLLASCGNQEELKNNVETTVNSGTEKKVEQKQKVYLEEKETNNVEKTKNLKKRKILKPKVEFNIVVYPKYWELEGTILSGYVDRIDIASIKANTDLDNISYYTLKKFKEGDKKFIYRISSRFDNIPEYNNFHIPYSPKYNVVFLINYFYSGTYIGQDEITYDELKKMLGGDFESKVSELYQNNLDTKLGSVLNILKEKGCNLSALLPTKEGERIKLSCEDGDGVLTYKGDNIYILGIEGFQEPLYIVYIKGGKVEKEGYEICGRLFKTLDEFYNLTGELAIGYLYNDKCKFIDITTGFKYSGYYHGGKLLILSGNSDSYYIYNPKCVLYDGKFNINNISGSIVFLSKNTPPYNDTKKYKAKIKYFSTKYGRSFLLYSGGNIMTIGPNKECDYDWVYYFSKTFLNGKEIK